MCPRLVEIGPFTLHSFGTMVILGFLLGMFLAAWLARTRGLPGEALVDGAVWILFASILGARLLYVALNWNSYSGHPLDIGAIWQGGMSFHGGAAAGILTGVLYLRRRKLPALAFADAAAPGLALGAAVGRVGCLLNGCCYGGPTNLPWAISVPGGTGGHHPAQVYDGLLNLALCGLLVLAYRRPHRTGQVLALWVGGYAVTRFLSEMVRSGVTAEVLFAGLTQAQWFSIVSLLTAAVAWLWLARHGRPGPELTPPAEAVPSAADETPAPAAQ